MYALPQIRVIKVTIRCGCAWANKFEYARAQTESYIQIFYALITCAFKVFFLHNTCE